MICHPVGENVRNSKLHMFILKYLQLDQEIMCINICNVQI